MKLRRDIFQAISDPAKRVILLLLTSQAMTAGAIAENFEEQHPAGRQAILGNFKKYVESN